jgi:hypothetical protein
MRLIAIMLALLVTLGAVGYHQAEAQSRIVGPSDSVRVVISDSDLDSNPLGVDRYEDPEFVVFRTSRSEVGEAHPEIVETGPNTGLFEFTIQLETDERACRLDLLAEPRFAAEGGSDPSAGVCPGDLLLVQYEDNRGADGESVVVDYVFEVESWNPEFTTDRPVYSAGDRMTVNIYDPDANRDPDVADSLRDVRVFSESDPAGQQFSAIETERNSGIFRLAFVTSLDNQNNAIRVQDGDEVTVQYIDDFPADFSALQEEKRFNFVITVGSTNGEGSLTLSAPSVRSASTPVTDQIMVGQQVALATVVSSTFDREELLFVAIIEVRDSDGVTVSIGWQTGSINPQDNTEVAMSWIPENPGTYELRTFLISSLSNPQILTPVASSEVAVS